MSTPGEPAVAFEALWGRVLALLSENKVLEARGEVLEVWRLHRHSLLADLIDALDVRLMRPLGQVPPWLDEAARHPPGKTFVFGHDWREWFTRPPDEIQNRLAIFEEFPDPAAIRVILELLLVAPPQHLIAERLWSVVERVLIAVGDVRAMPSLVRFVDGRWPPHQTHLSIQSVPHLLAAIEKLKTIPTEPELRLPPALEAQLGSELTSVASSGQVSPLDPQEANTQLQRFVTMRDTPARMLLADWLAESADPRGILLNVDHQAAASPDVECLRVRATQRWLSTASHPVVALEVRAGLPWSARIDGDASRSPYALSTPWPMWPLIESLEAVTWDDSLRVVTERVGPLRALRRLPWRIASSLEIAGLELLHTDVEGLPIGELVRKCPALREFEGTCSGSLVAFDQLRSLTRVTLDMPVTVDRVLEFAGREVAQRSLRTNWCEHRLIGRPGSLLVETTVVDHWFAVFELGFDDDEQPVHAEQQLFAALDATQQLFQEVAQWRFAPGNVERVEGLEGWLDARASR